MRDSTDPLMPDPAMGASEEPIGVRRGFRAIALAGLLGLGVLAVAAGGWFLFRQAFDTPPWRAQVVEVRDDEVCIVSFESEPDEGFVQPTCHGQGEVDADGDLAVGDCVEARVHHPTLVIERVIECPAGLPLSTETGP